MVANAKARTIGTIPILRQQIDLVGGVRKMAIFLDVQYYADLECVNGWVGQEKWSFSRPTHPPAHTPSPFADVI